MTKLVKFIKFIMGGLSACVVLCGNGIYAEAPYPPDFSLSNHILQEPPALPQIYNAKLPNAWEYYTMRQSEQNAIVPESPVIMEICAIIDRTDYAYPTKEELMDGCYRGDNGLVHLILQPYQYLPFLNSLQYTHLMPSGRQVHYPQVIIYYKATKHTQNILTSLEFENLADINGVFMVNDRAYQYNQDAASAFYSLIYEMWDSTYLPDENTEQGYAAYRTKCNFCY